MPTITTTVGGADANSYADLAFATAYFESRLGGEVWLGAEPNQETQEKGLLTAMRVLEQMRFIGARADSTQALEWPRIAVRPMERTAPGISGYSLGGLYDLRGRAWDDDEIPTPIKQAQCEIALAMIQDEGYYDESARQVELMHKQSRLSRRKRAGQCPDIALELLQGFLLAGVELQRA